MGLEFNNSPPQSENPKYSYSMDDIEISLFSKIHDHPSNATNNFVAVMVCSDADEDCPFINGADLRVSMPFIDPKAFDETDSMEKEYDRCSLQIGNELREVFESVI